MVNVVDAPVQLDPPLLNVGVTVIVPDIGAPVMLVDTKFRLPVPLAPRPIAVLVFVQLNVVPAVRLVKLTAAVAAPAHSVWLATAATTGVGFTVIVKLVL